MNGISKYVFEKLGRPDLTRHAYSSGMDGFQPPRQPVRSPYGWGSHMFPYTGAISEQFPTVTQLHQGNDGRTEKYRNTPHKWLMPKCILDATVRQRIDSRTSIKHVVSTVAPHSQPCGGRKSKSNKPQIDPRFAASDGQRRNATRIRAIPLSATFRATSMSKPVVPAG